MAIFWNHIKGTGNATNNGDGLWTWIEWSKPESITAIPVTLTDTLSPEIKIRIGNGDPEGENIRTLGHIVTTKANVTVEGNWTWQTNQTTLADNFTILLPNTAGLMTKDDAKSLIIKEPGSANNDTDYFFQLKHWGHNMREFYIKGDIVDTGHVKLGNGCHLEATGYIKTTAHCEASYFNATSDKRAKENITPATFSGLDLINKLSLYTFNYKNTTETVPGILAQDLLEVQPKELDLVDNIAATGENGDYMSIKADKLIFVLMQAIKEQQAQIDDLKAQIQKLTK